MARGRPRANFDLGLARELRDSGRSWRAIGRALGISHMTVKRALEPVTKSAGATFDGLPSAESP